MADEDNDKQQPWAYLKNRWGFIGYALSLLAGVLGLLLKSNSSRPLFLFGVCLFLAVSIALIYVRLTEKEPVIPDDPKPDMPPALQQQLNPKLIDRLLKTIDEKDITLEERAALIKELTEKAQWLEQQLAERAPTDAFAQQAKERLDAGDFEGAVKFLIQSMESNLAGAQEQLEAAAKDAFEIANLKELQLDYRGAKPYYEKAVKLAPENTLYLNDLGHLVDQLGEPAKAIEYFEKALEIDKTAYGVNHPAVAIRLNNIGLAQHALGEPAKAIEYYEKALDILRVFYGEKHPHVAACLNNIGSAWFAMGDCRKALEYGEKAHAIIRDIFGDDHPDTKLYAENILKVKAKLPPQ